jgi:hypothetical protein
VGVFAALSVRDSPMVQEVERAMARYRWMRQDLAPDLAWLVEAVAARMRA